MREAEFKAWLSKRRYQGKALTTVGNRVGWIKAAERALPELGFSQPTLDAIFADGQWNAALKAFSDLRANWQSNEAAARAIAPQSSDPHLQVANTRQAVGVYGRFLRGDDPNYDDGESEDTESMAGITRASVEAAMNENDRLGQAAFLAKYERGLQGTRYWVRRGDSFYPSKAIANAAFEIQTGQRGTWGGTEARRQLVRLGYTITDRDGRAVGSETEDMIEPRSAAPAAPVNLILYGPPGTGKTYATAAEAVRLCGETVPDDRAALMKLYRSLQQKGRIGFVTFHQNFSYEDFVEGLRPVTGGKGEGGGDSAGFSLQPQDGIFKLIADLAASNRGKALDGSKPTIDRSRKIFKMSLGRSWASEDDAIYQDAIDGGYVVLGWGGEVDWSDPRYDDWAAIKERWRQDHPDASGNDPNMSQMYAFRINMQIGSLVVISDGNRKFRAIGEIEGPYQFVPGPNGEYNHRRKVKWLWRGDESLPRELIYDKELSQVSAYQLNSQHVNWDGLEQVVAGGDSRVPAGEPEPFALIIDEINRANISKVFGELITLIEPDKRLGMPNALTVKLPYSKQEFGVPANLHIIGTMNTADRSIALLDTALRRRFRFKELAPNTSVPAFQDAVDATGLPLDTILNTINDRIEYFIDREHRIGHAFFIGCKDKDAVDAVMRDKVIPLLQEYFFEDWSRVAAVLGEPKGKGGGFLDCRKIKDPTGEGGEDRESWSVRKTFELDAYHHLIGKPVEGAAPDADELEGVEDEA